MGRLTRVVCGGSLVMLAVLAGTAAAGAIYRSVDAQGNVTFSSKPPTGAVSVDEVNVRAGPSEAAQREARERLQRQETTAGEISEARVDRTKKPDAAAAPAEAEKREVAVDQYYGSQNPNTGRRDRLQGRPVQLPALPVPR